MTPEEFNQRMSDIDVQEPSLHKLDKKMTIIIMQQVEALSTLGKHDTRLECVEKEQAKSKNFVKGAAAVIGIFFTALTTWLANKK